MDSASHPAHELSTDPAITRDEVRSHQSGGTKKLKPATQPLTKGWRNGAAARQQRRHRPAGRPSGRTPGDSASHSTASNGYIHTHRQSSTFQ